MVILNRIYTRTGDDGHTGIGDGTRVSKLDARILAGGSIDETNSSIGLACACDDSAEFKPLLTQLQQWLFDLGADISCPWDPDAAQDRCPRITAQHIERLEAEIDRINDHLSPLSSFVLPGGSFLASSLHVARSVCRRAEVDTLRLQLEQKINPQTVVFLNRLSDLLFVLARNANDQGRADVLWQQGTE